MLRLVSLVVMMTSKTRKEKEEEEEDIAARGERLAESRLNVDVFHSRAHRRGAR